MERESFIFYKSFYEAIKCMPPEVQAEIYPAIMEYALLGKQPQNMSEIAKGMFMLIKPNIDANTTRYENGKKGSTYGKRGGRPRKNVTTTAQSESAYQLTYKQEVEQMKADSEWSASICKDYSITEQDYTNRLSRFLRVCNESRSGKPHDSLDDAKSHFRYWMDKVNVKQRPKAPQEDFSDTPFPEVGSDFGGMDYDEQ